MSPDDLKYTKDHEWIRVEDDVAVVGVTDYAQKQMGDVTYVELPEIGKRIERGGELGVIESVKSANDVYAPVSGKVGEVNKHLEDSPEVINSDPYGDGWVCRLDDISEKDVSSLMDARQYDEYIAEQ